MGAAHRGRRHGRRHRPPALARITVSRNTPSESYNPFLPFTLGGGIEWTQDGDQTEWDFPLFLEYTPIEQFQISIETRVSSLRNGD
jgi:hypothetical protein